MIQLIGVHGSTDEQAAITRAVRAPFQDLRRRDARALCEDFTPPVAVKLTSVEGSCASHVSRLFARSARDAEYVPSQGPLSHGRVEVRAIRLHDDRATADSVGPGVPARVRHWQLARVDGRWRIATPATLQMQSDCDQHPFGGAGCLDVLSMRLDRAQ
ncbi:MAG TPA: hypothetical protein VLJ80_01820 [Solirubrobacteraceae bacterium]|nr:hypothetical protein [Solirubrobacteraceae bacterium]